MPKSSMRSRMDFVDHLAATQALEWLVASFLVVVFAVAGSSAVRAQSAAEAARPPLNIAILVSSRTDLCFDPGDVAAVTRLVTREQDRINALGGVAGRSIRVRILDDDRDAQRTIANVRSALADPQTLAMVGLSNSTRAKAVFDALGQSIEASGIPFISNISTTGIFAAHKNVFTTQASQEEERVPVMVEFIRHMAFKRPAFVGLSSVLASMVLGDTLKSELGDTTLVADHRLSLAGDKLDTGAVTAVVNDLKLKNPDILVLNVGTARAGPVIKELAAAGVTPALFVTGRIEMLPGDVTGSYRNAIYELVWDRLPEAYSERLRRLIAQGSPQSWIFEGTKNPAAPGWIKGECKPRSPDEAPDPISSANLRALGIGAQFADMVGLVAASLRGAQSDASVASLRAGILSRLSAAYAMGSGAYKGSFQNWSFQPESRTAARTPFVSIQPQGLGRTQLAPTQFVRLRSGRLRPIETLYVDIDLIRAHRIDDNEKAFFVEFYLAMHDNGKAGIEQIEFTNAYLDPRGGRQLTIETLHPGGRSDAYPSSMKIYKVSGRFVYEPDLAEYPFDTQRFSIDLQPKKGDAPFIIQAPPLQMRDQQVATDGWDVKTQYVGYDDDFVPVVDAYTHQPSVVPFYKASFVWIMKRQTTDYFLRVVVPLAFILAVAYLSIFISRAHFEAIVTIQVTALLSAVALYLALPKLDSDTATLSDRIFVFIYMSVSLMIGISILRVNARIASRKWLPGTLAFLHIVAIPLLVVAMAFYVWDRAAGQG